MNRGQKIVLGVVVVGGGTALAVALSKGAKAAPPPPPPPGKGAISISLLPAGLVPPYILIDGGAAVLGSNTVDPGQHTVSFGPISPYTTPPDQVVQVLEGQTVEVVGIYTAPPSADVRLESFGFAGAEPFAPSSAQLAIIGYTNPTSRSINYQVYAYPSDPGDISEPVTGTIGIGRLGPTPPGSWSSQFNTNMPSVEGTYPIWLRFYEYIVGAPLAFIKRVYTGRSVVVGTVPPPPPPGWPIVDQVASIAAYLVDVWSTVYPQQVYDPYNLPTSDLREMLAGQQYWIEVVLPCTLSYAGKTWNLAQGQNLITW